MHPTGEIALLQTAGPVIQLASQHVLSLFQREESKTLLVHDFRFAADLLEEVTQLARQEKGSDPEFENILLPLQLASLFHPAGRLVDYQKPALPAQSLARQWFAGQDLLPRVQEDTLRILGNAGQKARSFPDQVFYDAVQVTTFLKPVENRVPLLKLEMELHGFHLSKKEWNDWLADQLLQINFYTRTAQLQYGPKRAAQINIHQKRLTKDLAQEGDYPADQGRLFHSIETRPPLRAAQTYFRVNYRNHINLSSIADNKANIMISVNSILISILFTLLTYGNVTEVRPMVLLPAVIFILTGVVSLVFAIFSARPKVTQLLTESQTFEKRQRNIMFFGNFVQMDLHQYEEALDSVLRDGELLYGNMARDLYFLGKVLDKKYRYLTISYNIFMAGLVAAVFSFFLVLFF